MLFNVKETDMWRRETKKKVQGWLMGVSLAEFFKLTFLLFFCEMDVDV